jgi:hypothetical protein
MKPVARLLKKNEFVLQILKECAPVRWLDFPAAGYFFIPVLSLK